MYSEEAEAREEQRAALELEREDLAMKDEDTRKRVKKYDRLKKKTKIKVGSLTLELIKDKGWLPNIRVDQVIRIAPS